jgi:predicted NBD/HSP70 family sugar kinase
LELDKSTITNIVNDMLAIDLVHETSVGEAGPQGGRKPIFLTINKDFGSVLGIEIQPESYTIVAVNMSGEMLFTDAGAMNTTGENLVENFLALFEQVKKRLKDSIPPLIGVGVGVSGIVNQREGKIVLSIPLGITEEFDLARQIAGRVDVPVFLDNDANCCAWGEIAFHRSEHLRNFLFALVEFRKGKTPKDFYKGIALGIGAVIEGRVYYGQDFSAGEFRSTLWREPNAGQFSLTDREMLRVEADREVRARFIDELSKNLALLVNTLDFNRIFLGGDIEKYESEVKPVLEAEIRRNWSYSSPVNCQISFSSLGPRSVAYGAAGMFLGQIFTRNYPAEHDGVEELSGFQLLPAFMREGSRNLLLDRP